MHHAPIRARRPCLAAAAASALLISTAVSRADLTVVSRVTVTRGPEPAAVRTITTRFHGDVVRTETDRLISFYDGRAQTLTTIDKKNQTYRTVSRHDNGPAAAGLLSRMSFQASARIEPTDETRMIAGKQARRYKGHATITMAMNGISAGARNQTIMEIDEWAAEGIVPPASLDRANPVLRLMTSLETMRGMEPLARELARVKGMPLSSRIAVTAASDGEKRPPVVTETEVVSLSDAPLSADLFRVPAGFRKVDPAPIPSTDSLRALHEEGRR